MEEFVALLGKCRREYPVIGQGRYRELALTNRQYAYARMGEDSSVITVLNNDDNPAQLSVPVPLSGAAGEAVNLLEDGPAIPIQDGKIQITIKGQLGRCP